MRPSSVHLDLKHLFSAAGSYKQETTRPRMAREHLGYNGWITLATLVRFQRLHTLGNFPPSFSTTVIHFRRWQRPPCSTDGSTLRPPICDEMCISHSTQRVTPWIPQPLATFPAACERAAFRPRLVATAPGLREKDNTYEKRREKTGKKRERERCR